MSNSLPTGSSYGSQILTSGDLSVRELSSRNKYTVYRTDADSADVKTSHLFYVADATDSSVTECSRVISEENGGKGYFSLGVLETVDNGIDAATSGIVKTFKAEAETTTISVSRVYWSTASVHGSPFGYMTDHRHT